MRYGIKRFILPAIGRPIIRRLGSRRAVASLPRLPNMLKIVIALLFICGAACFVWAARWNRTASFDDGSFIGVIALFIFGGGLIVVGVVLFFLALLSRG